MIRYVILILVIFLCTVFFIVGIISHYQSKEQLENWIPIEGEVTGYYAGGKLPGMIVNYSYQGEEKVGRFGYWRHKFPDLERGQKVVILVNLEDTQRTLKLNEEANIEQMKGYRFMMLIGIIFAMIIGGRIYYRERH